MIRRQPSPIPHNILKVNTQGDLLILTLQSTAEGLPGSEVLRSLTLNQPPVKIKQPFPSEKNLFQDK